MDTIGIEAKQALRMRRFFMAIAMYAFCAVVGQICASFGYLPPRWPMWWAIGVTAVNSVFFFMLFSGQNLRLRDPSMTEMQLIVSMFAAMIFISQADEARGAFLLFVPVPLLFGVLRLNFGQMMRVGMVGLIGYAGVIASICYYHPERVKLPIEMLYLLSLAAVMFLVCVMCGYISRIRSNLSSAIATISELAHRDSLTGLFNRRDLMDRLEVEVARNVREAQRELNLCMIDLDHFKAINDKFGHTVGDEVLILVGKCIEESIRIVDYVARYGGEEFVLILGRASDDLALTICERVRERVSQLQIKNMPGFSVTISVGIARSVAGETSTQWIKRADEALYEAKENGRNCVRVASASELRAGNDLH
ncbi:MAG: GGDEF domain-containing protein [Burkholderiales bacterium]